MDMPTFLGLEREQDERWSLPVTSAVCTPGRFLFGGCGLAAGVAVLEAATDRAVVWASAQYLAHAPEGAVVTWEVTEPARGHRTSQARALGRMNGTEIISVTASTSERRGGEDATFVRPPEVADPEDCPARELPPFAADTVFERVEQRLAKGRHPRSLDGTPSDGRYSLWARIPGQEHPTAATLALLGDYVTGGVGQALGRMVGSRSLDNTIRVARLAPTTWILCAVEIHAVSGGVAHGLAQLWTQDGVLLGTASQTMSLRWFSPPPR